MIQFFNQTADEKSKIPDYSFCPYCGTGFRNNSTRKCLNCGFVQYKNPLPGVSVIVSDSEGSVLLGKRKNESDSWCLPCGFIELNENFLDAAHREVKEETGLDIEIDSIVNVVSNIINPKLETIVIVLLGKVIGGEMRAGDDLIELKWVDSDSLPKLSFAADDFIIKRYFQGSLDKLKVDERFTVRG